MLASEGGTFFFDSDADFLKGFTSTLRTELLFGDIADGTGGSLSASDDVYLNLVKSAHPAILHAFALRSATWQMETICHYIM